MEPMEKTNQCKLCEGPCYDLFDLCGECAKYLLANEIHVDTSGPKIMEDFNRAVSTIVREGDNGR